MTRFRFAGTLATAALLPSSAFAKGLRVSPSTALDRLRADRAAIAEIRVTHVDDLTQTQTPIAPAQLGSWPSAFHHESHDRAVIEKAFELVEASHPQPSAEAVEVRWQLVFLDANGEALLTLSHHSHEPFGYIGESPVTFESDGLLTFLRSEFGVHEKTLDKL